MSRRPDRESRVISKDFENKPVQTLSVLAQTEVADSLTTSAHPVSSNTCSGFEPSTSPISTCSSVANLGVGTEEIQQAQIADPVLLTVTEWVLSKRRLPYARLKGTGRELRHF